MPEPSHFSLALLFLQLTGLVIALILGIYLSVLIALQKPLLIEFYTEHRVGVVVCGKVAITEEMLTDHVRPLHHFVSTGVVAFTFSLRFF